jgi:cytochrome c-type biogenesis protein CcmH/NrfG
LLGLGAPLALLARRLGRPSVVGGFGGALYFLAHAAVDWIWTVPAVGVVALLLLGIGAAGDEDLPIRRRVSLAIAAVAVVLGLFAFAPPWLAYRYVTAAYKTSPPGDGLSAAQTLDPLSLEPDWAEWRLARTDAARIAALERARSQEPKSIAVLFQLALAYRHAGREQDARAALQRAHALDPLDLGVRAALRARH